MRPVIRPLLLSLAIAAIPAFAVAETPIEIHATPGDPGADQVARVTTDGQAQVEAFFGKPFPETIHLTVAPDRKAFDAAFPASWGMTATECWMVGLGVADFLVILSPSDWDKEACDHHADDDAEVSGLVAHELTHVYHGQMNPTRDFTGANDIGWFVEGVAVLAAGQLSEDRLQRATARVRLGEGPKALAEVWTGPDRYGLAGSMAAYIDHTYGRETLAGLLPLTRQADVLAKLGVDESRLLADWRAWLLAQ